MGDAVMAELGVEPFEEADVEPDDIQADDESSPGDLLGDGAVTTEQALRDHRRLGGLRRTWSRCSSHRAAASSTSTRRGRSASADGLARGRPRRRAARGRPSPLRTAQPDEETFQAFLELLDECSEDTDEPHRRQASPKALAEDGTLTAEQAQCLAEEVFDELGD